MKYLLLVIPLLLTLFLGVSSVKAQQDITPPALLDVRFEPEQIDTSKGPVTITVTVHVTDDLSGVEWVSIGFRQPNTTQNKYVDVVNNGQGKLVEGDYLDGVFVSTMTLPQYAAFGIWEMYVVGVNDNVGNSSVVWKPDNKEDAERGTDTWLTLYNGFAFAVGDPDAPQEPARQLFMPSISGN